MGKIMDREKFAEYTTEIYTSLIRNDEDYCESRKIAIEMMKVDALENISRKLHVLDDSIEHLTEEVIGSDNENDDKKEIL